MISQQTLEQYVYVAFAVYHALVGVLVDKIVQDQVLAYIRGELKSKFGLSCKMPTKTVASRRDIANILEGAYRVNGVFRTAIEVCLLSS